MRVARVHVPPPLVQGSKVTLPDSVAYHLTKVLRMRAGALVIVFDGIGNEHYAEILTLDSKQVTIRIEEAIRGDTESPLQITLVQGVSRAERMDWTLQKATELGVHAIAPVITSRSVVRLDDRQANKKLEHWQAIVVSACEQSGRRVIPVVHAPVRLHDYFAKSNADNLRLVLDPEATITLTNQPRPLKDVELLIGPEGGLDDDELQRAVTTGFTPVRLGPRILRTETASVVALSVMQALWGDLQ
ncbi:MAG TPA: 16S rRNA (uracil(1498)-N(3))-methyltransferase [Steroidobacteraceae bacterium]|jgi:16S rRNA (uracil1498-N3)-methyltransferase|nr:16S rRNA (uracil(1498)-N(3))-methyltransferase [Steroidobacteraceae bacterium]